MRSRISATSIALVVIVSSGFAQEPLAPISQRLSLRDAVHIAMTNNHNLIAARLEVDRADARVREAWGSALPRVDLKARYTRALKKPVFFLPDFLNPGSDRVNAIEIGSTHALDMTFSADQTLFNSAVFIGVGAARIYARGAREQYKAKALETMTNARKAYYRVLLAGEVLAMLKKNLENAEENARNARLLTQQGLVSEYDGLRAEVSLANLRPEVIQAESGYRLALNALKAALGLPYSHTIEVTDSLRFQPLPEELLKEATASVLQENPSLAALRYQAEVNDAIVSAERSGYLPTLSAFGNYQFVSQNNTFVFSVPDFIPTSTIGLSLSLNIFSGFQTNARVEQAQLDFRKSQEQIANTELNLQTLTESIVLLLRQTQQRIEAQGKTVEQAERGYRIATARFRSGAGTQLEVNDARLAQTFAEVNRMEALFDYLSSSADLDQALGRFPEGLLPLVEE